MKTLLFVAVLLDVAQKLWAEETCCPDLGCYDQQDPFDLLPPPQCPEEMGINTKLYTRQNPTIGQTITRDTIPAAFKGKVMAMFIVHGWRSSEDSTWVHDMKDAALEQGDYNVITVGWKLGAEHPYYPQSASNTRTVGGEIALITKNIINNGNSSKALMYCVGHSLGAHVCGHAGQQGQLGRITGLDPAGPLFEQRDWSVGLNPSCADLVDVIHTNCRVGLGISKVLGHVDFYLNGGTMQPGCTSDSAIELVNWTDFLSLEVNKQEANAFLVFACSHLRAHEYFKESIRTPDFISRFHCSSPFLLHTLSPSDKIQSMGFNANTYDGRGIFCLETNSAAPYARG